MSNKTQYEEFWKEREETLGQSVLVHSLVRTISRDEPPSWGLLYATSRAVYFQTFTSSNWFDLLISGGRSRSKDAILEIPLERIQVHEHIPGSKGFLGFGRTLSQLKLIWQDDSDLEKSLYLEIDGNTEKYLELLPGNDETD